MAVKKRNNDRLWHVNRLHTERNHKPARKVAHVLLPFAAARNKSRIRKTHTVRGGLTPRRRQAAPLPFVSLKCHIYVCI